ncbi:MAG TPA: hypothetical protein VGH97_07160 [Thermoanaerobaculia bacterium]|jgi:hypothetical protein
MLRWVGIGVLFVLLCAEVLARGPLELKLPPTILSNAEKVQKDTAPYLAFLHWVALQVPRGVTLAVRTPDSLSYFIAIGQLPDQTVWPATGVGGPLAAGAEDVDWVACYFSNLDDARYERVATYANGSLHRRRR